MKTISISDKYAGERLDKTLLLLFPETSLRHRRRLFTSWNISVDGVAQGPAYKVRAGQELSAFEKEDAGRASILQMAEVCAVSPPWAALCKPAGLDSETLAGGSRPGLDQLLAELDSTDAAPRPHVDGWQLVSRLDRGVSGLVAAAQGFDAVERFRRMETAGEVGKTYLLLANPDEATHFPIGQERIVKDALDMAARKKVRVLDVDDPEPARWTRFTVLGSAPLCDEEMTLVRATIGRGARHQIRAHAAVAGLPIAGDSIYGTGAHPAGILFLHCAALRIEDFVAQSQPPWESALGMDYRRVLELSGLVERPEK